MNDVESPVIGFIPPAFEKAALLLEGKRRLSCSGGLGGKRAMAMLLSGSVVAYLIVAMSLICSRYRSIGIRNASANSTIVLVE